MISKSEENYLQQRSHAGVIRSVRGILREAEMGENREWPDAVCLLFNREISAKPRRADRQVKGVF